jgi:hypothetical protein
MRSHALVLFTLLSGTAFADAIPGPMDNCPKGHKAESDHGGQWCQPPAPRCADGERAIPTRGDWYCEPPPPKGGCPGGSEWRSTSREDTWCDGQKQTCDSDGKDPSCKKTALCVKEIKRRYTGRVQGEYIEERVISVCGKGNACAAGYKCVTAKRYVVPPPAPKTQPSPPAKKGALILIPLFAIAVAAGAAFRRRRG